MGALVLKVKTQKGIIGGSVGAAITVFNQSVNVVKLKTLCSQYLACFVVSEEFGSIYLISVYFNFKGSTEKHLDRVKGVFEVLKGKDVDIAIDANAKYFLRGSKATDFKGELVKAFIHEHSLEFLNQPGNPATHRNFNGYKTNIDVTLATLGLSRKVDSWKVKDWSTSDHRPIELTLNFDSVAKTPRQRERRFNTRLADWKKFPERLEIKRLEHETFRRNKTLGICRMLD